MVILACLFIRNPEKFSFNGALKNKATLAQLIPNGAPGCDDPSITKLEVTSGNSERSVIVRPLKLRSGRLNRIVSCCEIPLANASVSASRKVPWPESALLVTTNTAGNALNPKKMKQKKSENRL